MKSSRMWLKEVQSTMLAFLTERRKRGNISLHQLVNSKVIQSQITFQIATYVSILSDVILCLNNLWYKIHFVTNKCTAIPDHCGYLPECETQLSEHHVEVHFSMMHVILQIWLITLHPWVTQSNYCFHFLLKWPERHRRTILLPAARK